MTDISKVTPRLQRMKAPDDWDYGGPGRGSYSSWFLGDGKRVAAVVYGPWPERSEGDALVSKIVRAVNHHDELVAALEAVLSWMDDPTGTRMLVASNHARLLLARIRAGE